MTTIRLALITVAAPLLFIVLGSLYLVIFTNLPQSLYMDSVRNIYFDCMQFVDRPYVYKMKPGPCRLSNIEYNITLTHDSRGFRNESAASENDIAVLGDSHAHGFGVADDQIFSYLLGTAQTSKIINLAVGSYATQRELETMREYAQNAKYVILQYCDNDASENDAALRLSEQEFRSQIETGWKSFIASYHEGKALGLKKPIADLANKIINRAFISKSAWRDGFNERDMAREASLFPQIIDRYRDLLGGKRLIVFESAGWGFNSPKFEAAFTSELSRRDWLTYKVLDSSKLLDSGNYYFLDDHLNPSGHRKLAVALAREIAAWEKKSALIETR